MDLIVLTLMIIPITIILRIILLYNAYNDNRGCDKKKCKNCKYYMDEVETRTPEGLTSLCSERYISVMSTDSCEKYTE